MKFTTVICVTFSSVLLCACTQSSVDLGAEQAALATLLGSDDTM